MTTRIWQGLLLVLLAGLAGAFLVLSSSDGEDDSDAATVATPTAGPAYDPVWVAVKDWQALAERYTYIVDTSSGALRQLAGVATLPKDRVDVSFVAWSPENEAVVTYSVQLAEGEYATSHIATPGQAFEPFFHTPPVSDRLSGSAGRCERSLRSSTGGWPAVSGQGLRRATTC